MWNEIDNSYTREGWKKGKKVSFAKNIISINKSVKKCIIRCKKNIFSFFWNFLLAILDLKVENSIKDWVLTFIFERSFSNWINTDSNMVS